jgi:CHAT domain
MKHYINLLVSITPNGTGSFAVKVSSSQGTGNSTFKPPFQLADVIGHAVGPTRWRSLGTVKPLSPGLATARECGVALFEALFAGDARDILAATEAEARTIPDTGVRIRLAFDLGNPATAEVAALPWELMRRRNDDPLVVTMQTALVRALDVPKPIKPRPLIKPLRILMIRANPEGTDTLNLAREGRALVSALRSLPDIVVDDVAPVPGAIRDQLGREDYHVVHYMGHGDYRADRGGMLLLENENGSAVRVSGTTFAAWLKDEPLRLVFLNACETGATPDGASAHPFCGVAAALIQSNAPAVVAMQFPISDTAAIEFARTFYTRIARGLPVDAAVAEGRKALFDDEATEWATPVLYLRPADGNLFDNAAPEPKKPPPEPAAPTPEPAPVEAFAPEPEASSFLSSSPEGGRKFGFKTGVRWIVGLCAALLAYGIVFGAFPWEPAQDEQSAPIVEPQVTNPAPEAAAAEAAPALPWDRGIENETSPAAEIFKAVDVRSWIHDAPEDLDGKQLHVSERVIAALSGTNSDKFAQIKYLAGKGYPEAEYVTGYVYSRGLLGVPMSVQDEDFYMTKAAIKELPAAQYYLATLYQVGSEVHAKDTGKALEWLRKAQKNGSPVTEQELLNYGAPN